MARDSAVHLAELPAMLQMNGLVRLANWPCKNVAAQISAARTRRSETPRDRSISTGPVD
jgi:hypothetical protein